MNKFADVRQLYNISSISNDYFEISFNKYKKYVKVFKVEPIIVLNSEDKNLTQLLEKYEEFLRNTSVNFEVILVNKKVEINEYFNFSLIDECEEKSKLLREYEVNMKKLFEDSKLYEYNYYIIFSSYSNEENVEKYIDILRMSGVNVEKINSEEELKILIMKGADVI